MNIPQEQLLKMFQDMTLIRRVELKIEDLYHLDEMKTPVHLSLGQEAVAAGICAHLNKEDTIFSNHRSHGHYLAKGGGLQAMMAELYCKEAGCAKGRGGSMHLIDTTVGHLGSSAIVAGGVPHAVGSAFAAKMQKKDFIAVAFFGDAAVEQGVFYESLNWAAYKKLPVLFVCENNYYAVCSHLGARQKPEDLYKRSHSFGIPSMQINGMDIFEVYEKAGNAIAHIRQGKGPYYIVCDVQRWRQHAGSGDPKRDEYRVQEDLGDEWHQDPLLPLRNFLIDGDLADISRLTEIEKQIDQQIEDAFAYAQEAPLPDPKDLMKYLFV